MASKILVVLFAASSAIAAPQTLFAAPSAFGAHSSQVIRSPFGTRSAHFKTVSDGTSLVHKHDSRLEGARGIVRVARPQFISSGPFAVQAFPHQTPFVVGDETGARVITAAQGPSPSTNLFQTPDGRIFAFSNGNAQIQPGQIFQTPDGRIFTTAVINQSQLGQAADEQATLIESVREANNEVEAEEEQEEVEEEQEVVEPKAQGQQQQIRQQQQEERQQLRARLQSFAAVPSPVFVSSRTPFDDIHATHFEQVQTHSPDHVIAAAPAFVRAAPVAAPIGFSLADGASTGYFTYPGAGVAFNF